MDELLRVEKVFVSPISPSAMVAFHRCKRLYLFRYKWRLVPKYERVKPSITLGRIYHRMMQTGDLNLVRAEVDGVKATMARQVEQYGDITGEVSDGIRKLDDLFDRAKVVAEMFWQRFPPQDWIETLGREIYVETDIEAVDSAVKVCGVIDRLQRNRTTGDVWIRDVKTTSKPLDLLSAGYSWSAQCQIYRCLAAAHLGTQAKGFILDLVRMPGIKFVGGRETWDEYRRRVEGWYRDKGVQVMRSEAIIFTGPAPDPNFEIALRVMSDYATGGDELADMKTAAFRFERTLDNHVCQGFMRRCDYCDLCSSDMAGWPGTIEQLYEVRPPEKTEEKTDTEGENV